MHTSFLNCHDFRYIPVHMERAGGRSGGGGKAGKDHCFFFLLLPVEQSEKQHSKNSTLHPAGFMHSPRRRKGNSALMETQKCCSRWSGLRNYRFVHSHFVTGRAKMTGCAKRCKQGFVKFVLSLHRLVTGTLIKGKKRIFSITFVFEYSRVWIYQYCWYPQGISAPLLYCEQLWWGKGTKMNRNTTAKFLTHLSFICGSCNYCFYAVDLVFLGFLCTTHPPEGEVKETKMEGISS